MRKKQLQHHQRGATLVVVLMMLLVITIVGVLAIRTAMTSLNIATNSQIGQLLLQTSDAPTNFFLNQTNYKNIISIMGVVGKAVNDQADPLRHDREYVFCYRPTSAMQTGSILDVTVLIPPAATANDDTTATVDTTETNRSGFCDLEKDFGSSREAVVTQVAVKYIAEANPDATPGSDLDRGTDASKDSNVQQGKVEGRVRITSTAILPNYSREKISTVQAKCIGNASEVGYINDNTDAGLRTKKTMAQCLTEYGIPVNTQVQEIDLKTRYVQVNAPI
ncbi:PilX N-terminal domain-containing pilus assembly protein [Acinetobacter sp. NS-4]|uniref:PilX N-terminal domain-containing pilus assembly protein n=1 Tax=Acinetobacter sp. NS-4 TaxID=3127956 RepID=UPI00307E4ADC